ncbi:MAG TPA: xylulokinase [Phycisphaerales bacterium]|nr:xylulokinase [Phycisphaerales bacterium]
MSLLLGIDVGTSSVKVIAINPDGAVLAAASASYPLLQPQTGWTEQDPESWWQGTIAALRQLLADPALGPSPADRVQGIGLSGQMHGSVLLDAKAQDHQARDARALRPALLWNDQRTAAECTQIEKEMGGRRRLVEYVGNAALTGFTLPKLLWVRGHEPHIWSKVAHVLMPKDFIRLKLTGELATDVGDASGTLVFNVDERRWSESVMSRLGLSRSIFPRALESTEISGRISSHAASLTGLKAGTIVVGGSGDNQCGALGAGVVAPGLVLATLGTSGVLYAHAERPRKDLPPEGISPGRLHTMCAGTGTSRDRTGWCVTGVALSAAGSLQWARDQLFPQSTFDELIRDAQTAEPGCDGLVFLPYLTGERCPYAEPRARGGWIGLTSRHTRAHMIRAIIEGVTFSMAQILDLVRSIGVPVTSVRIGGGGAKSPLWRQMQADLYGCPVVTTNTEEGPAFGAALMAGVGAGLWQDAAQAANATIRLTETRDPGLEASRYTDSRRMHHELWPAIRPIVADNA